MKKNFKLVLALVLAAMMIVGSLTVTAVGETKTRTISISGLETGDTVNFYKVLDWADDTDEAAAHASTVSGWYWSAPFDQVLNKDDLFDNINDQNQLVMTDTLAGKIARVISAQTCTPVNGSTPVGESSGTATYTISEDTEAVGYNPTANDGLYMAIVNPAKQDYTYNPIFVHLDSSTDTDTVPASSGNSYMNTDGKGAAKKSNIPLEKEATNANDYNGDNGDTTKPGDVLDFKVTTAIPGYGDTFTEPHFKLTDTLKGLKLKIENAATDFVIKVGGQVVDASDYTPTGIQNESGSYSIDFKPEYLKGIKVATELTIEYKATVQEGANTNVIKEKNTVELEYSHDPSTESTSKPGGDKKYQKDVTNHYTFSIDANNLIGPYSDRIGESGSEIIKIGVDKNGDPITEETTWSNVTEGAKQIGSLEGAEFELLKADGSSFSPKKTATSDASGRINFTGLDEGTYQLKETKAPAGYVKNSDPVNIVISAELAEKTITEYTTDGNTWISEADYNALTAEQKKAYQSFTYKTDELVSYTVTYGNQASSYTFDHEHEDKDAITTWKITESSEAPQSITNTKGVELPSTGGIGTTIFYVGGSLMVLAAAILLITKRRMGVED